MDAYYFLSLFQLELIHRELNVAFLTEVELALKMRGKRWPADSLEDEGGGKKMTVQ